MALARALALRALFLLVVSAWALAMVYTGLGVLLGARQAGDLALSEGSARWLRVGSLVLVSGGAFVFALALGRCFPLASPRVKLASELSPWIGALLVLVGGWL